MRELIEHALIFWLAFGIILASLAEAYINYLSRKKRVNQLNEAFLRHERLLQMRGE
jgi:hypothetical protein